MRLTYLLRLLILTLLLAGTLAVPAIGQEGFVATADDYGDDDDDNEGRGNDDDDDDDNQGRGNDKDKKDKKDKNAKKDKENVTAVADYRVEVTCEPTNDGADTACTFAPVAPEGGKKVSHLVIPDDVVCAEVIGGDGDFVDPDPNVRVTGYRFTGNTPYTLVLEGEVTTLSTATYWVKAANYVYPATGAALACDIAATLDESTPPAGKPTPEPTAPPAATGTIVVEAYACANIPADTSDFDWYGACAPDTTVHSYQLAQDTDATNPLHTADSDDTGTAAFGDLAPGAYNLDDTGDRWCHAESDSVNAEGNVVVEAGVTSTVWLFYCPEGGS